MEEAHCDRTEFLSNYPLNVDEIMLIPGSLGRIRPRDPKSTTCKMRLTGFNTNLQKNQTVDMRFSFPDDPKVVVANLTVSNKKTHAVIKQTQTIFPVIDRTVHRVYLCVGEREVRSFTCTFLVSVQNADSALQAIPEAAFTQEASLRQQPQDRGRPPADGEEVARQVTCDRLTQF